MCWLPAEMTFFSPPIRSVKLFGLSVVLELPEMSRSCLFTAKKVCEPDPSLARLVDGADEDPRGVAEPLVIDREGA